MAGLKVTVKGGNTPYFNRILGGKTEAEDRRSFHDSFSAI